MLARSALACCLALTVGPAIASADPVRRLNLGVGAGVVFEDSDRLVGLPLAIHVGYAVVPWFLVVASAGAGKLYGDEAEGWMAEILIGAEADLQLGSVDLGGRLDVGYERATLEDAAIDESFALDAFVVEPRAVVRLRPADRWGVGLEVGPRWRWVADDPESPRGGFAIRLALTRAF
jgi:hypothetical protein